MITLKYKLNDGSINSRKFETIENAVYFGRLMKKNAIGYFLKSEIKKIKAIYFNFLLDQEKEKIDMLKNQLSIGIITASEFCEKYKNIEKEIKTFIDGIVF